MKIQIKKSNKKTILVKSNALDHTVDIFRHHLNELTVYEHLIHNFKRTDIIKGL